MLFSKFFVIASKDKTRCAVLFGEQPPTPEQMQEALRLGEGAYLDDSGNIEQPLQEILNEVSTADLLIGGEVIWLWIYQFFVAGWNSGNARTSPYTQPMTVDQLRKLVVTDQQHVAVRELASILRKLGFDFKNPKQPVTCEKVHRFLVGSFQAAYIICRTGHGSK